MIRTYSLAEVAAKALPPEWKDPELWLKRRLRRGDITGYKVGHTWRMREQDIDDLIARHLNTVPAAPAACIIDGLTARGARRLRAK
jgi:hypothetical protein